MRYFSLFFIFLCIGLSSAEYNIRTDSDAKDTFRSENPNLSENALRRARAMADFSTFLNGVLTAPNKRRIPDSVFDKLYDALELDPGSKELQAFVSSDLRTAPRNKEGRIQRLAGIAEKHPEQIRLNLLAAGTLASRIKKKDSESERIAKSVILLEQSLKFMKKRKSKPEEQVSLYSLLALLYASQKEYGKADDLLEDALRIIPKEKRAELLQSAMSVYLEALKHASDRKPFPFGWFADSDKEKYTKKFHEVSDEFANILTSPESSLNVDTFMPSAAILRDKGQNDLALLILTSPLFANPGSLQALKRLGAYYYATKNYANAARIWKLILSRQKRVHPYDSYMYASSLLNSGNPKEAVEAFDRHLTLFPKDILPMHPYAASALLAGKNRTAVQIVGKISNPKPETLYIKALAEERLGEYSAALDTMLKYLSLRKFASREERYPVAMQTILIADKAKRYDAAASLLEPMIDEDPENPELLNLLGYIYAEAGIHLKKAGELLTRAVRLAPDNAAILDSMAWLLYRQKQYKEAWEYIQKSLASLPKEDADAVILDHAGDISLALGRKAEAVRFWKRALSLYSPDADRGKILKKLKNNEKI